MWDEITLNHILLGIWLLIRAGIKLIDVSKNGPGIAGSHDIAIVIILEKYSRLGTEGIKISGLWHVSIALYIYFGFYTSYYPTRTNHMMGALSINVYVIIICN